MAGTRRFVRRLVRRRRARSCEATALRGGSGSVRPGRCRGRDDACPFPRGRRGPGLCLSFSGRFSGRREGFPVPRGAGMMPVLFRMPGGVPRAPGDGVAGQRRQDAGAQPAPSERRPGGPQRTSGDGAWGAPTPQDVPSDACRAEPGGDQWRDEPGCDAASCSQLRGNCAPGGSGSVRPGRCPGRDDACPFPRGRRGPGLCLSFSGRRDAGRGSLCPGRRRRWPAEAGCRSAASAE